MSLVTTPHLPLPHYTALQPNHDLDLELACGADFPTHTLLATLAIHFRDFARRPLA